MSDVTNNTYISRRSYNPPVEELNISHDDGDNQGNTGAAERNIVAVEKNTPASGKKKAKARVAGQPEQLFVSLGLEGWDDLDIRDRYRLGVRVGIAKVQAEGFDTNKRWADHTAQQQETAQDTLRAHLMEYFGLVLQRPRVSLTSLGFKRY
jgi:hypothetical protein